MKKFLLLIASLLLCSGLFAQSKGEEAFENAITSATYSVTDEGVVYTLIWEEGHNLDIKDPRGWDYVDSTYVVNVGDNYLEIWFYDGSDPYFDEVYLYIFFSYCTFDGEEIDEYLLPAFTRVEKPEIKDPDPKPTVDAVAALKESIISATYKYDEDEYTLVYTLMLDLSKHTFTFSEFVDDDALGNMYGELTMTGNKVTIEYSVIVEEPNGEPISVPLTLQTMDKQAVYKDVYIEFEDETNIGSGVEAVQTPASAKKIIRDGALYLQQANKTYSIIGVRVR